MVALGCAGRGGRGGAHANRARCWWAGPALAAVRPRILDASWPWDTRRGFRAQVKPVAAMCSRGLAASTPVYICGGGVCFQQKKGFKWKCRLGSGSQHFAWTGNHCIAIPCMHHVVRSLYHNSFGLECARNGWQKNCLHFSICACHPCAGAMLIFSVSFQF